MIGVSAVTDILKYSAAGSAAFTLGSFAFDIMDTMNIQMPGIVNVALATATGVKPSASKEAGVDLNTEFA